MSACLTSAIRRSLRLPVQRRHGSPRGGLTRHPSCSGSVLRTISSAFSTTTSLPGSLVSCEWLAEHLPAKDVKVVDATWYMPNDDKDAAGLFTSTRVPGASFFDLDAVADTTVDLPHMLPPAEVFAEAVGKMGISEMDTVIIYDQQGFFSAPRAYYTFKIFGAQNVAILDGGLPMWSNLGLPTASGPAADTVPGADFQTDFNPSQVVARGELLGEMNNGDLTRQVLDARPAGRFTGRDPEPRPGLPSGHMPGAVSVPFSDLISVDPHTKTVHLKSDEELRGLFESRGVDLSATSLPITTTCGSGVTAAGITFALEYLGKGSSIYDGSWTEWASFPDSPIVKSQ